MTAEKTKEEIYENKMFYGIDFRGMQTFRHKEAVCQGMQEYSDQQNAALIAENGKLKSALNGIMDSCDNQNDTHEVIWRIAYETTK